MFCNHGSIEGQAGSVSISHAILEVNFVIIVNSSEVFECMIFISFRIDYENKNRPLSKLNCGWLVLLQV